MNKFNSIDDILDFAISREEEAAAFYIGLAGKMENEWMKKVFEDFAKEEQGHKAKLESIKAGKTLMPAEKKILDLKIGDYLVRVEPDETDELDYQKALVIAMKREKAAFRLYSDLAEKTEDESVKTVLLGLAQEEAKHKLRFEVEYDDFVLTDN